MTIAAQVSCGTFTDVGSDFQEKGKSMPDRWVGLVTSNDKVVLVDAEVPDVGPIVVQADQSWTLQAGDRGPAYAVMHGRVTDYLQANGISKVVVKASALSTGSTKLAHLTAAELRGVVIAAVAATNASLVMLSKALVSRTFGDRKTDEYVADTSFWQAEASGCELRAGSREAALLLLSSRKSA